MTAQLCPNKDPTRGGSPSHSVSTGVLVCRLSCASKLVSFTGKWPSCAPMAFWFHQVLPGAHRPWDHPSQTPWQRARRKGSLAPTFASKDMGCGRSLTRMWQGEQFPGTPAGLSSITRGRIYASQSRGQHSQCLLLVEALSISLPLSELGWGEP